MTGTGVVQITWFKVDDGLPTSRKILSIPRSVRLSAVGLWTLAGAWSAGEELDGHVPDYMVTELGGTPRLVDALIRSGLWEEVAEGAQFSNWAEYQPTRAELEAARAKEAERKRRWREHRTPPSVPPGQHVGREPESGHPDPTRPDPTINKNKSIVRAALERDFDDFWKVYPRKDGKQAAQRKYATVRKTVPAEPILEGARAYALMSLGKEKEHVKMAQGWLNDGRWADELQSSIPLPPRDDAVPEHVHRWLPNGSCNFCAERQLDW